MTIANLTLETFKKAKQHLESNRIPQVEPHPVEACLHGYKLHIVNEIQITKEKLLKPNKKPKNRRWVKKFKKKHTIIETVWCSPLKNEYVMDVVLNRVYMTRKTYNDFMKELALQKLFV